MKLANCNCCGYPKLIQQDVLWKELTDAWNLSEDEIRYINRQQGFHCDECNTNLRAMALAQAFMNLRGYNGIFSNFITSFGQRKLQILEINQAGNLHQFLKRHKGHLLAEFPSVDMTNLPYKDNSFDYILHSDTLEHVPDPIQGLKECLRVLKPGGACLYTVPLIVDRLTRSCEGRPPSYHGNTACADADYLVRTEYGCDAWKHLALAGFKDCRMYWFDYPAASALCGMK